MSERILNQDGEWVERTPPVDKQVVAGRPSDPVRAWRWVSAGLLVKLIALVLGVVGVAVCGIAGCFTVQSVADAVVLGQTAAGIVALALILDAGGRLLCLATPEPAARAMIIASVGAQAFAVLGAIQMWASEQFGTLGLLMGLSAQLLSATLFVVFLQVLAARFQRAALAGFAGTVYVGLAIFALLFGLLALVGVVLYGLYFAAGIATILMPMAGLGAFFAVLASSVILLPIALLVLLVLLLTYICYAVVLVGVRRALPTKGNPAMDTSGEWPA